MDYFWGNFYIERLLRKNSFWSLVLENKLQNPTFVYQTFDL
ncbi:hypothetical protein C943_01054 [Mariniradius saccharolyticus AK6]|uniref:Uncharacterized protein n=1 Tax=Mariniradius saccharolyticus AK6 TaxID=1239962 RepID=M7XV20_9BACT|nr:hypothetical protein C943_01054 [Mariniradius saccharolyticus AK6]